MLVRSVLFLHGGTFCNVPWPLCCCHRAIHDTSVVPRVVERQKEPWKHRVNDSGYTFNYHRSGQQLPRLKDCMNPVRGKLQWTPQKIWSKEKALFGQNDYIDILGDGSVHPAQLQYHVPAWLRGFPGFHKANELVKLIHYRNIFNERLQQHCPKRWHDLSKQIHYLMKYNNYKKQDEMHDERDMGLWDEEPDYSYYHLKNKMDRRSYLDDP